MAIGALTGTTRTAEEIFDQLTRTGVSKAEAQLVVANWILGNAGALPRSFALKTPFAATEPGCTAQFARSFSHQDWVDGEDVGAGGADDRRGGLQRALPPHRGRSRLART